MINIISYLHRDELCDLIRRWMVDRPVSTDANRLAQIILFNQEYVSRFLNTFAADLFAQIHGPGLVTRRISLKGELKDLVVQHPPYLNDRIEALIRQYRAQPGRYYRETPFQGTIFLKGEPGRETYVGSTRIKRVRRLAEKCARIITDQIFYTIKSQADVLAEERARRLGLSRAQLVTPQQEMIEEFLEAEKLILEQLSQARQLDNMPVLNIKDVAGIKVITEDVHYEALLDYLKGLDHCEIVEEERHAGVYNATNLIVRLQPEPAMILAEELSDEELFNNLKRQGIPPGRVNREFAEFVRSGEDSVFLEIIVTNYQENLESEIGRCIHEDRIIEQRRGKQYRGHLAKNIEYLMEYLFTFPTSGEVEIGELPIKLWNRYLPEYFDEVMKELFHLKNRRFFSE
jgi:cell division inhibitor SulA